MSQIWVIINPVSGTQLPPQQHFPALLQEERLNWKLCFTEEFGDARGFAEQAVKQKASTVVVYGGDGTVMEVAQALHDTTVPLAIVPGGTANVMAKELGIAATPEQTIHALRKKEFTIRKIDMGMCNGQPFLIRVNIGILADMVHGTNRKMKSRFGQFAYAISAIQHILKPPFSTYTMLLDGYFLTTKGASVIVTNSGNIGLPNTSLSPKIDVDDGILDVVLVQRANVHSLIQVLKMLFTGHKPTGPLRHWRVRTAEIRAEPTQTVMIDDKVSPVGAVSITILPKSIQVLIPKIKKRGR
jgi:diacylglycerol kinase (ATP)